MDPKTQSIVRVTGRADWAFNYSGRQEVAYETFLVAMEAKWHKLFGCGKSQHLTYLAILQELRIRVGKINAVTQGFYTDGYMYRFMAINAKEEIQESPIYNIDGRQDRKTVFNFIVTILDTPLKSFPTVTPTKTGKQYDKKINNFDGEI